jgi:RimJ/RimL family protein N-acetyltransferase
MTSTPCIETKRLILRGHAIQDFDALHAMWTEPAVYHHTIGHPATREETWSRLLRYLGHWALLGYGYWAVEEKSTGSFVGEMGFADFHRDIDPPLAGQPELGWILKTSAHGRGYATEALTAIVSWGDAHFGAKETACIISPENEPSIRVARKIGFQEKLQTAYKDNAVILFTRPSKT